jgi:hypothetical protein
MFRECSDMKQKQMGMVYKIFADQEALSCGFLTQNQSPLPGPLDLKICDFFFKSRPPVTSSGAVLEFGQFAILEADRFFAFAVPHKFLHKLELLRTNAVGIEGRRRHDCRAGMLRQTELQI